MITTLTAFKARLKIPETELEFDTDLTTILLAVGGRFDAACNRKLERGEGLFFEYPADRDSFIPLRYPIESITAWHLKSDETTGWELEETPTYSVHAPGEERCLVSLSYPLGSSYDIARITYTGGYVMPGTEATGVQTALPGAIEGAALEQAAFLWQRRDQLGIASMSAPGSGGGFSVLPQSASAPWDLLPQVKNLLSKFERWVP